MCLLQLSSSSAHPGKSTVPCTGAPTSLPAAKSTDLHGSDVCILTGTSAARLWSSSVCFCLDYAYWCLTLTEVSTSLSLIISTPVGPRRRTASVVLPGPQLAGWSAVDDSGVPQHSRQTAGGKETSLVGSPAAEINATFSVEMVGVSPLNPSHKPWL